MRLLQELIIDKLFLTDKHPWPRGALRLKPNLDRRHGETSIQTLDEFKKFARLNVDVYLNVFSDDQVKSKEYDKIFLDIDDPLPDYALMKLVRVGYVLEKEGLHYSVMRSGSKGFHVYIFFKSTLLSSYRECVIRWLTSLGIETAVDLNPIEHNRVARIPYSENSKGVQCIPEGNSVFEIDDLGSEPKPVEIKINNDFHSVLKTFDVSEKKFKMGGIIDGQRSKLFSRPEYYPECMSLLVDDAEEGVSLGHIERVEMGKFLLHVYGGDVDQVSQYYSRMDDYKERMTKYQLNHLKLRGYKMMNCKTMSRNGLCPISDQSECPFSPSINSFIRQERSDG